MSYALNMDKVRRPLALIAQFAIVEPMQRSDNENNHSDFTIDLRAPRLEDGADLWRLTRDTGVLDLNSSYQYLLWCRDFAETSVVGVTPDQRLMGFVTGFLRPDEPGTLMIWQVAVDSAARGRGLASRMLDYLVETTGVEHLETTVTDDNAASKQLFASLADRHEADHTVTPLFTTEMYPDGHDTEYLHRIGPLVPELLRHRLAAQQQLAVSK
jgi:diaminobutyrate acetyltransferase